jgi:hypothetical protein
VIREKEAVIESKILIILGKKEKDKVYTKEIDKERRRNILIVHLKIVIREIYQMILNKFKSSLR